MLEKSIRCSAKRSAYSDRPSEASHSLTDGIALRVPLRECLGAAGPAPQKDSTWTADCWQCGISTWLMSALGQQRTSPPYLAMSALPPKADIPFSLSE